MGLIFSLSNSAISGIPKVTKLAVNCWSNLQPISTDLIFSLSNSVIDNLQLSSTDLIFRLSNWAINDLLSTLITLTLAMNCWHDLQPTQKEQVFSLPNGLWLWIVNFVKSIPTDLIFSPHQQRQRWSSIVDQISFQIK